jgi:o-succinylbenzoate synthase
MRFVEIKYKKFRFPFNLPIQNSAQIINHKDVIILKAQDEYGVFHYGEVGPLGGFSQESVSDCESRLVQLIARNQLNNEIHELKTKIKEIAEYPSLMFGLEQLILSAEQKSYSDQLEINKINKTIKINGLLGIESKEAILQNARRLFELGYETIKLKIGRADFQDDVQVIKTLDSEFGDRLKLRLDNNGSWSLKQAVENIKYLSDFNIEYIEQPVKDKNELLLLAEDCQVGLATDECIIDYNDAVSIIQGNEIDYLVLKPSIRIGIYNSIRLIELANKTNIKIIISSAFETAITRSDLLYLASLTNHDLAHGLATDLLGADIIPNGINYNLPHVELRNSDNYPSYEINLQ